MQTEERFIESFLFLLKETRIFANAYFLHFCDETQSRGIREDLATNALWSVISGG